MSSIRNQLINQNSQKSIQLPSRNKGRRSRWHKLDRSCMISNLASYIRPLVVHQKLNQQRNTAPIEQWQKMCWKSTGRVPIVFIPTYTNLMEGSLLLVWCGEDKADKFFSFVAVHPVVRMEHLKEDFKSGISSSLIESSRIWPNACNNAIHHTPPKDSFTRIYWTSLNRQRDKWV